MAIFIFLWLVVIIIQYVVAKKFEEIALNKGYDESIHSCAMCFWLGIVGYLYVIALPNLNYSSPVDSQLKSQKLKVEENEQYQYMCLKCKKILSFGIEKCPVCGQVFDWNK